MIFRLSSNLGDSMFSKDGGSSAFLEGLFCCLNTFIIEKGIPCILLEFSVFQLVSTLVYSTLQQVSVPRALPWGGCWQPKAMVVSKGWTNRLLSNLVSAVFHCILVGLFYLPHSTAFLELGSPQIDRISWVWSPSGRMEGKDLLALLVLKLTGELLQPRHRTHSLSLSTRPFPETQCQPASPSHLPSFAFAFELHQGPVGPFLQPILQRNNLFPQSDSAWKPTLIKALIGMIWY